MKKIVGVMLIAVMLVCMLLGCSKSPNESKYDLSEELRECMIGDTILMGKYRQTRREKDGVDPIQWIVVAKENDKVLLVSYYVLDYQKYHDGDTDNVDWETSSVRKWLNETFYNNAFDSSEKDRILTSNILDYYSSSSTYTLDRLFFLSSQEIYSDYKMSERRTESSYPTDYASGLGATGDYWLRDTSKESSTATIEWERHGGEIEQSKNEYCGVRPAMWVKVN